MLLINGPPVSSLWIAPRASRLMCSESWPLITSPSNSRLKLLKKLQTTKHRQKLGLMLLEGHRLVLDAMGAGIEPEFVVVHDAALARDGAGARLEAALQELGPDRVLRAPEALVAALSDTNTPQGVLAVMPQQPLALPTSPSLVLVCDAVSDPGNLGTLLRSAAGAGVGACLLTPGCCDPWGLKTLRAGMGAQFRMPVHGVDSWAAASEQLARWQCAPLGADAGGTRSHFDVDWTRPSAIVVGSEAHGLSDAVRADATVELCSIPLGMRPGEDDGPGAASVESLNAAVAGSVILFEAQRQRLTANSS